MKKGEVFLIGAIGENRGSDVNRVAYFGRILPHSEAEKVLELTAKAPEGWRKEVRSILAGKESWTLYADKEQFELDQMLTKEQIESLQPDPKLTDALRKSLSHMTEWVANQLRRDKPKLVKTKEV